MGVGGWGYSVENEVSVLGGGEWNRPLRFSFTFDIVFYFLCLNDCV